MDMFPPGGSFRLGVCIHVSTPLLLAKKGDIERCHFLAIGIIGATVMPHSLFLGSALATQDRLSATPLKDVDLSISSLGSLPEERRPTGIVNRIKSSLNKTFRIKALDDHGNRPQRHEDRENNSYSFVKSHVYHGVADIVLSLLGVAVVINSMWVTVTLKLARVLVHENLLRILIVASAVFYYGEGRFRSDSQDPASLFDAHDLLSQYVGKREWPTLEERVVTSLMRPLQLPVYYLQSHSCSLAKVQQLLRQLLAKLFRRDF